MDGRGGSDQSAEAETEARMMINQRSNEAKVVTRPKKSGTDQRKGGGDQRSDMKRELCGN